MRRVLALVLSTMIAVAPVYAGGKEPQTGGADVMRDYVARLPIGATVEVRLRDGEKFKAILMAVQDETIVVKPRKRVPVPERVIPIADLESVELERKGGVSAGKAIAIGVGTGVAAFFGIMLMLFAVYGD
jgi:hypothetical protein